MPTDQATDRAPEDPTDEQAREAELRALVERLGELLPRDGAHLTVSGDGSRRSTIGNRRGYLRLGVELLRAALAPLPATDTSPAHVDPALDGLLSEGSAPPLGFCEVDEAIVSRPPVQSRLGALGQLAAAVAAVVALLAALLAGVVTLRRLFW